MPALDRGSFLLSPRRSKAILPGNLFQQAAVGRADYAPLLRCRMGVVLFFLRLLTKPKVRRDIPRNWDVGPPLEGRAMFVCVSREAYECRLLPNNAQIRPASNTTPSFGKFFWICSSGGLVWPAAMNFQSGLSFCRILRQETMKRLKIREGNPSIGSESRPPASGKDRVSIRRRKTVDGQ